MIQNHYYIIDGHPDRCQLQNTLNGKSLFWRTNKDQTKTIMKTARNDNTIHKCFQGVRRYTYAQILKELKNPEWQYDEL